ncbi:DUF4952 domain-containing protein [Leptospira interrogans]|uniref:DUF4952 domain-containing protein n=1 Tax=Leptospira interrogans TaxID=173 RepID=UPI0020232CEC|nr:DUF4952 domain-containing protein [Leptospira interrogans]MCL8312229.1 DUF4952 domain-containing protein [Leptospira interrogans]
MLTVGNLKIQMKQSIVFFIVLFCTMSMRIEYSVKPSCGDFLERIHKKPKHLEFIECKKEKDAQISVLQARYQVKGTFASSVEKYLIHAFGMQPLRHICCIWETVPNEEGSRYGSFKGGEFHYSIDMGADGAFGERKDWSKIDWFYVTVELPLNTP